MTGVEFKKQLFRLRTYFAFGLMAGIPTLMTLAFKLGGGPRDREDTDLFALATHSGLNMPLAALAAMSSFLLPVVIVIFAGSSVAEESSWGSLRYLLLRPLSRSSLLVSKLAVVVVLSLIATFLISAVGLLDGVLAFGWHPLTTPALTTLAPQVALSRLVIATVYVAWSMTGVMMLAFFISTVSDASIGAVSAGIGVAIVSQILDAIPPLRSVRSVLPTHHWHAWEAMFADPVHTDHMIQGVLLQVPYIVVFAALAWYWFNRRDITT